LFDVDDLLFFALPSLLSIGCKAEKSSARSSVGQDGDQAARMQKQQSRWEINGVEAMSVLLQRNPDKAANC